jgi:hypothetical protein
VAKKLVRKVQRVATEGALLHFHLECGHLIKKAASDFSGTLPSEIECWACEEEHKKSMEREKQFNKRLR